VAADGKQYTPVGALIVDDEQDVRLLVRLLLDAHNEGLFVSGEASSGSDALEQIMATDHHVVVLDQMMPGMDGLETAAQILKLRPEQRIILFSAFLDDELEAAALRSGIVTCLRKDRVTSLAELVLDVAAA
jgi:two-component system response regulator YesN